MAGAFDSLELLEFKDRAAWRKWLERNHSTSSGVRILLHKKNSPAVNPLTYDQAVEEALCFGWIDTTTRKHDDTRYAQVYTPRKKGGTWAKSNKDRVARLVKEGLMTPAGMAAIEAAKTDGSWTALDAAEALEMPADLAEAFAADPAARRNYEGFSLTYRKYGIYWVTSAKRAETRAKRVTETVRLAKLNLPPTPEARRQAPPEGG